MDDRLNDVVGGMHRAVVCRSEAHVAESGRVNVTIPVADVQLPPVVGLPTVRLDNEPALKNLIDSANPGHVNLEFRVEPHSTERTPQHRLLSCLAPPINLETQSPESIRKMAEQSREVVLIDFPEKQRVVEGRDRMPRVIAPDYLCEGIYYADSEAIAIVLVDERMPMQPGALAVDGRQGHRPSSRASRPGRRLTQVNMGVRVVETKDAFVTECGNTR